MKKTITYDPAVYKLVPIRSASEMDSAADVSLYVGPWGASDIWDKMIAAVPDQLLVVEHSGEPIGFLYQGESAFSFVKPDAHPHILGALGAFPVFTHPAPSQPSDETMAEISQLKRECARLSAGWQQASYASQPSAEALVQAALEAASVSQWISVEDRLPETDGEYLGCFAGDEEVFLVQFYKSFDGAPAFANLDDVELPVGWWMEKPAHAQAIRALSAQQIIESCKEKS